MDTKLVERKIAPSLEVVAHCSQDRKLCLLELFFARIFLYLFMAENLHNRLAAFTIGLAAMLVLA
jgi:hypothetical protein